MPVKQRRRGTTAATAAEGILLRTLEDEQKATLRKLILTIRDPAQRSRKRLRNRAG